MGRKTTARREYLQAVAEFERSSTDASPRMETTFDPLPPQEAGTRSKSLVPIDASRVPKRLEAA